MLSELPKTNKEWKKLLKENPDIWMNAHLSAWDWLEFFRRYPIEGVSPSERGLHGYKTYVGWKFDLTEKVTADEYKRLKKLFIDRWGCWQKIDIEKTTYGGERWATLSS